MNWKKKIATKSVFMGRRSMTAIVIAILWAPVVTAQSFNATTPSASFLSQASRMAVADFNGDGIVDQVRVGYQGGSSGNPLMMEIYLGNGDGTFGPSSGYPNTYVQVNQCANPVALATYNRDASGNTSVALLCYDTLQIWYPFQTHSTSGSPVELFDNPAVRQVLTLNTGGAAMAIGDFTGRGSPGIAVLEYGADGQHARSIAVYSPNSNCSECSGSNAFPPMVAIPDMIDTTNDVGASDVGHVLLSYTSPGSGRANLAVATVVIGTCGGTLSTYYSSGSGGNFVHGSSASIPQPLCPTALAAGDLNGDGYPDIIVGGGKTSNNSTGGSGFLSIYLGSGNGAVYPLLDGAAPSFTDASVPFDSTALAALDMNGDGNVDIVESGTYSNVTHIYSGAGDATFSPAQTVGSNVVTLPSGTQVTGVFSTRAGSINLDGSPDLVLLDRVADYSSNTTPEVGGLYQVFTGRTASSNTSLSQGSSGGTGLGRPAHKASGVSRPRKSSTLKGSWTREEGGSSPGMANLQASVDPAAATGWVQFFDATTQAWVGSAQLENGSASLTTSLLGTHYFVAMYYGDSTYTGSQSGAQPITPSKIDPYVYLQVDPSAPKPGDTVTFTVNVSDYGATPGGSVTLVDTISGSTLGTITLDNTGNGTFSTSSLAAATYDVVGQYSGDRNYNAGTSVDQYFKVGVPLIAATATLSASTADTAAGTSVMLTAAIANAGNSGSVPTGTVDFQIDGATVVSSAIVSGAASASVTAPNPGIHRLQAVYRGDSVFSPAYSNYLPLKTHGAVIQFSPGSAVTLAGIPSDDLHGGFGGDGGPATSSYLHTPFGVTADGAGNVYIADEENNVIRKVSPDGTITTVAGVPYAASIYNTVYSGDGGLATSAYLDHPTSVVLDAAGNLYIADYSNNVVRKVDATTGIITTIAGNHSSGTGYNGDGAGTSALVYHPSALALDTTGNLYIADSGNNLIRKLDTTGNLTTIAGNYYAQHNGQNLSGVSATSVDLYQPMGVAIDPAGNLYISDTNNQLIRKVNTQGIITTFAGGAPYAAPADNVPALSTTLNHPQQITLDVAGDIYFAEAGNEVIRKIDPSGLLTTPIGYIGTASSPWSHFDPQGEPSNLFQLIVPSGVAVSPDGSLLATDTFNQTIIRSGTAGALLFGPSTVGTTSTAQNVTLSNVGDVSLTFGTTPYVVTGDYTVSAGTTLPCDFTATMAPGAHCNLSVAYANAGGSLSGTVVFSANVSGTPTILLKTNASAVPTATTLYTPGSTATKGDNLLFLATVQAQGPAPAGSIAFYDGTTLMGTGTIANGYAYLYVSTLGIGTHSITAQYAGSGYYAASTSDAQSLVITGPGTGTVLTVSSNSPQQGAVFTMTATVATGNNAAVTEGSVIFYDGSTVLATRAVDASGIASFSTTTLSVGTHTITAAYQQNADFAGSTSSAATVTVSGGGGGGGPVVGFDYIVTVSGLPVTIHRGDTATVYLDYSLLNNSGGSLVPTCGTLPSYASCSFSPARVILNGAGADQPVTLTISTTAPSTQAQPHAIAFKVGGVAVGTIQ